MPAMLSTAVVGEAQLFQYQVAVGGWVGIGHLQQLCIKAKLAKYSADAKLSLARFTAPSASSMVCSPSFVTGLDKKRKRGSVHVIVEHRSIGRKSVHRHVGWIEWHIDCGSNRKREIDDELGRCRGDHATDVRTGLGHRHLDLALAAGEVDPLYLFASQRPVVHRQLVDQAIEGEVVRRVWFTSVVADTDAWIKAGSKSPNGLTSVILLQPVRRPGTATLAGGMVQGPCYMYEHSVEWSHKLPLPRRVM